MKSFYIITSENEAHNSYRIMGTAESVRNALERIEGVTCSLHEGHLDRSYHIPDGIECVIAIGGDGTMLRAARAGFGMDLKIIGINRGHMGYLTELSEISDYGAFARRLVNDDYTVQERMMLSTRVRGKDGVIYEDIALNEVMLGQNNAVRMMDYEVYVNDVMLNSYKADGLLIASPTGSTGYSMSAGGPIAAPSAKLLILTPVCPHSINVRSILLAHDDIVTVIPRSGLPLVSCDGADPVYIECGDRLVTVGCENTLKFIKFKESSFLDTLRTRMRTV